MTMLPEAIDTLIEANAALRKSSALTRREVRLERAMAKAFTAQRRAFLARFAGLERYFPPEVREAAAESDWLPIFDRVAQETAAAFQKPLTLIAGQALESGMVGAVADIGTDVSFTLKHPAAVEYLTHHGANSVRGINAETRRQLRTILAQAAEEGWSYNRTAKAIIERYDRFAGRPSRRYLNIRTRAQAIAVFEVGNAYEAGNMLVAKDLQGAGLTMEKQWLTVGDDRVRPSHRANQGEGWIPLDQAFSSGGDRPPEDAGCRCTLLMRRKPDA